MPLDSTFAALADPTRRAILSRLAQGEASINELAAPFAISQPAISRHIKVLTDAGLILRRIDGTHRPVTPGDAILIPPGAWHQITATSPTPLTFLCCCAPPYQHTDTYF